MPLEEKYKGKTINELKQIKQALQQERTQVPPEAQKQIDEELAYIDTFDLDAPAGNWEAIKKEDTAESIIANNPSSEEIIENAPNSLTKKTVEEKGNRGDNQVAMKYDPSYWNSKSTEEIKKEQINNVDKTPPEEPADKGDFSIGGSLEGAEFIGGPKPETKLKTENSKAEGKKEGQKAEDDNKEFKGRYKSSMYGILDAMRNGDIDKSTGLYFMLDALSKAARNTGIDIGNIGAQFSGGTVRNDYQDSLWNQRKNKMFENEVSSELNQQSGTDRELAYDQGTEDLTGKKLANEATDMSLEASRTFNRKAEDFRKAGNDVLADLYSLVGSAATREIGPEEIIAIASSPVLGSPEGQQAVTELVGAATNLVKAGADTFGGLGTIIEALTNPKKFMQERMGDK